jgi:tRNA G10  N-methylase Trm11
MADFKHKDNTGSIFSNDTKGNEKAPSYKGTINVEGKEFSIALWVQEGKKGKFFSAKIEKPYVKTASAPADNFKDDPNLPF